MFLDICNLNDEKNYFEKKLKFSKDLLNKLADPNRKKRLPQNSVKNQKIPIGECKTRSSTLFIAKEESSTIHIDNSNSEVEDDKDDFDSCSEWSSDNSSSEDEEDFDYTSHVLQHQVQQN